MEPRSLRVAGAHGLTLHALEWSREGVPFVLLHGFGNDAHLWDELAPELAPYYRTLALDLRGHGDSDRDPQGRYDYDAHLADLENALEALGIHRLVLLGFSFGGRIAMLFAGRHPERMAGLVLVDTGPEHDPRGSVRIRLDLGRDEEPSFSSVEEYRSVLARAYPAARPQTLARLARFGLREREDGRLVPKLDPELRRLAAAGAGAGDPQRSSAMLWDALGRVACPTLLIRGAASDVLPPEVADRMVEEVLPDGRLALVPQAGHPVMVDNPDAFRDAVTAFAVGED